ncbi:2-oxoglutarate (2OG) and Fe(II)-dependent oxygenase superfamily protein [Tanacetum coccineum]
MTMMMMEFILTEWRGEGEMGEDWVVVYGASAHSDYGMITLLTTDAVPGLRAIIITLATYYFKRFFLTCRAFINNLGDMMERWTNCQHYIELCQPAGKSAIL